MLKVEIFNRTRAKVANRNLKKLLGKAAKALEKEKIIKKSDSLNLELTWVGKGEIQKLNKKYRKKNKPTDVISISYFERKMRRGFAGEIFICVPYARRQAKSLGRCLRQELEFLFAHGVLHIFGYDHRNKRDEAEMMNLAFKILGKK